MNQKKVALVTGSARRIGRAIANFLHDRGYQILLHYQSSEAEVKVFCDELNQRRANSARFFKADLAQPDEVTALADWVDEQTQSLTCLVNNASIFEPDKHIDDRQYLWNKSMQVNAHASYEPCHRLAPKLIASQGCIINLVDIYAEKPLTGHTIYCASKAANAMLVKSLALDLAPHVRVNGISPGAILWPDKHSASSPDQPYQNELIGRVPLRKLGSVKAITQCVGFILDCDYLTGQIINIDGGRSITI